MMPPGVAGDAAGLLHRQQNHVFVAIQPYFQLDRLGMTTETPDETASIMMIEFAPLA